MTDIPNANAQVRQFLDEQNRAIESLMGTGPARAESAHRWEVQGEVGFTGVFVVTLLSGDFKLEKGKDLHFEGRLGGLSLAGGVGRGKAVFDVPLEELTRGPVFVEAHFRGLIAAGCIVTWARDFKHLGTFVAPGIGIFGGDGWGSGEFTLRS